MLRRANITWKVRVFKSWIARTKYVHAGLLVKSNGSFCRQQ